MPRRLLLAADIVRDVAHSCADGVDTEALRAAADNLDALSKDVAQHTGVSLELNGEFAMLCASIRRLAAGLDPEVREPIAPEPLAESLAAE